MKTSKKYSFRKTPIAVLYVFIGLGYSAQADTEWPLQITTADNVVVMHQPQIDSWKDYRELELRAVVGVGKNADSQNRLGVLEGKAQTSVDTGTRNVVLSNLTYTLRFPDASAEEAVALEKEVREAFPGTKKVNTSLDQVIAYLDQGSAGQQKEVPVNLDPPQIIYSNKPAILVQFMGEPSFTPVRSTDPTLLQAVNTNWDVFMSTADQNIYLRNDQSWLELTKGGITAAKTLPAGLSNLPDDENWAETKKHIPGKEAQTIPAVYRTTSPAELIMTDGEPKMRPIPGTRLMQITNTPNLLFFSGSDQKYYFLVAGRWFGAQKLAGPWQAATNSLPEDFAKIPPNDVIAEVRSSVKGAPEAQDAVMLASVPTLAKVSATTATLEVVYEGEPLFKAIPNTQVQYAVNTPQDVFLANNIYYCCSEGVWFSASSPKGPWELCKQVDPAIYAIPSDHPKHNVTYVNIYDSGPDYVTYGYTGGYTGSYVANGLLLFGAGALIYDWLDDDDDDHHHHHDYHDHYPVPVSYYSYGVAAHYNYSLGGYYGAATYYGPYGGAGRYAVYNPATGTYSRGAAAYGPYSSAGVREAYNPWTDTYAARARVDTPYGSAGRFYAERDGDEIWGGSRSGSQGRVGWAQTSDGGKGAAWDTKYNEGVAIKNKHGDVMVGNDGNIYKREDGDWQKYDDGDWNDVNRPDNPHPQPYNAKNKAETRADKQTRNLPESTNRVQNTRQENASGVQRNNLQNENRARAATPNAENQIRSQRPAAKPATLDRSTYQNLENQNAARARGTANSRYYQQNRAENYSRPSNLQRQQPAARPEVHRGGARGRR